MTLVGLDSGIIPKSDLTKRGAHGRPRSHSCAIVTPVIAAIRHDYVDSDKTTRDICDEYGISLGKLHRLIIAENWPRRSERPPRELPPALKLREEARRLVANVSGGATQAGSPDRLDALVWAVTELTARPWQGPRIRVI